MIIGEYIEDDSSRVTIATKVAAKYNKSHYDSRNDNLFSFIKVAPNYINKFNK